MLLTLILIPNIRAEILHWIRTDCSGFVWYPNLSHSVVFLDWLRAHAVFEAAKCFRLGLNGPLDGWHSGFLRLRKCTANLHDCRNSLFAFCPYLLISMAPSLGAIYLLSW